MGEPRLSGIRASSFWCTFKTSTKSICQNFVGLRLFLRIAERSSKIRKANRNFATSQSNVRDLADEMVVVTSNSDESHAPQKKEQSAQHVQVWKTKLVLSNTIRFIVLL